MCGTGKAVRTGFSLGQADDNHFGRALPSDSEYKRYTGGYQKDPDCEHLVRWEQGDYHLKSACGGYVMNWKELQGDFVQPRRLPINTKQVSILQKQSLDPSMSSQGKWWMTWDETVRYNPDNDTFPIGTVIPSVLSLGPFSQDRGGISAAAQWSNGKWSLELKRRLKVDSEYDLPIEDGVFFWVAPFDRSQTRHAYHLRPLKISLESTSQ